MCAHVIAFSQDGGTSWLVGTDLSAMRSALQEIGAIEIEVLDFIDVLSEQYGGMALLSTL